MPKEQSEAVLPLLGEDQMALLASFMKLGVQDQEARHTPPEPHDPAVAAAKANGEAASKK